MVPNGDRAIDQRPLDTDPVPRSRPHGGRRIAAMLTAVLIPALLIPSGDVAAVSRRTFGPSVTVAGTAYQGATLTVNGDGFDAHTTVQIQRDGSSSGMPSAVTSARRSFATTLTVPKPATPSAHIVAGARSYSSVSRMGGTKTSRYASTVVYVQYATSTPTPAPTATPAPTPTVTPAPTQGPGVSVFGPGIAADELGNQQIGGTDSGASNTSAAYRFRATESSRLTAIRVYIMGANASGYSGGTGGTLRITVQTDDGSAGHFPSGVVLASTDVVHPATGAGNVYTFAAPAQLTAGVLYHVVFTNIDPAPTVNFVSVNGLYLRTPTTPRQPGVPDTDWGQSVRFGTGAWQAEGITPVMALSYSNGRTAGMGYMEVWPSTYQNVAGADKAREHFTVSGAGRTYYSVSLRSMRVSGSAPLVLTLQTAAGSVIGTATMAPTQLPLGVPGSSKPAWATATFTSPVTLVSGQSYDLVLSSAAGSSYSVFCIRRGVEYGYPATTYFADGVAQYEDGGGAWQYFGYGSTHLPEGDLQFYLR